MFKENKSHSQGSFFDIENQLSKSRKKMLEKSEENSFYRLIFRKIDEKIFEVLYSDKGSRPNAPVNRLVSAIILSNKKGWTTKEMMEQVNFNLLTRRALGLKELNEKAFCEATFFNFQNRVLKHFTETGENLIEQVFDGLTKEQLKELNVKTDIQRTDSFQAMSNIRSYTRVQLLVEMLIRLWRELSDKDKEKFKEELLGYTEQSSGQYVYTLKREQIPHELDKLGKIYHKLYTELKEAYGNKEIFRIFTRVYEEQFTVVKEKVTVKSNEELHSGMVQSPDDVEATYRKKGSKEAKGQSVNVVETANPGNGLNLLTDIGVESNNTDDSDILNRRIDKLKEKTPELEELHTDGAYASEDNDEKMEELEINQVPTGIRGRKSEVAMEIEQTSEEEYEVECPRQKVKAQKTRKRYKAEFNKEECSKCLKADKCPTIEHKKYRVYYFEHKDYLAGKRKGNIDKLPPERQKIRPNVEATVKEFYAPLNHKGKLRIRGQFKTMIYAYSMGIGINLGRIHRYLGNNPQLTAIVLKKDRIINKINDLILKYQKLLTNSTLLQISAGSSSRYR